MDFARVSGSALLLILSLPSPLRACPQSSFPGAAYWYSPPPPRTTCALLHLTSTNCLWASAAVVELSGVALLLRWRRRLGASAAGGLWRQRSSDLPCTVRCST